MSTTELSLESIIKARDFHELLKKHISLLMEAEPEPVPHTDKQDYVLSSDLPHADYIKYWTGTTHRVLRSGLGGYSTACGYTFPEEYCIPVEMQLVLPGYCKRCLQAWR